MSALSAMPGSCRWTAWGYKSEQNWLLRGGTLQDDGIGGSLGLQATVGTKTRTALLDEIIAPPCFVLWAETQTRSTGCPHPCALPGKDSEVVAPLRPGGLTDTEGKYAPWF